MSGKRNRLLRYTGIAAFIVFIGFFTMGCRTTVAGKPVTLRVGRYAPLQTVEHVGGNRTGLKAPDISGDTYFIVIQMDQ